MATEQKKRLNKGELIASLDQLPEDATIEDFVEHLAFILGVEEGIADLAEGRTISHSELLDRIKRWQT